MSKLQTGHITQIEDTGDNTRILRVLVPQHIAYQAGQYVELSFGGMETRPYSIASTPDLPYLEFHIRNSGYGEVSTALTALKTGDSVQIGIPAGNGFWRASARPLLALAGGTGIAPMKSIIMTHLATANHPPLRLYWGARTKAHLYMDGLFRTLERAERNFNYSPILSEDTQEIPYRSGFIDDALRVDFPSLDGYDIYLAGPVMMIHALYPQLLSMGAEKARIFGDGLPSET